MLFVFLIVAAIVTAVAALFDWRTGHIPDWISLGALGLAPLAHLGVHLADGRGLGALAAGAGFSLVGAALCGLVPYILWRAEAIGGGDVKLFAAVGALLGPIVGIRAELYAFIAGMLWAPAMLAYEGKLFRTLGNTLALFGNLFKPKAKRRKVPREMMTKMRFGPAIFAGTVATAIVEWGA